MCKKRNSEKCYLDRRHNKTKCIRVDPGLVHILEMLYRNGILTCGSCSGHGIYSMTIVLEYYNGEHVELFSNIKIPRKKRFYKKNKEGFYFIPEVVAAQEKKP